MTALPLPVWEETTAEAAAWDDRYWDALYDRDDDTDPDD